MEIKCKELIENFPDLFTSCLGSEEASFSSVAPIESPAKGSLLFVSKPEQIADLLQTAAEVFVLPQALKEKISLPEGKTALFSPSPYVAMAKVLQKYFPWKFRHQTSPLIHPTAIVSETAELGSDVSVGAYTIIHDGVKIGAGSTIRESCHIGPNTSIGQNAKVFPQVFIGRDCEIGDNFAVQPQTVIGGEGFGYAHDQNGHHHIPHQGKILIGNSVEMGSHCNIDRGTFGATEIGANSIIDSHVHIAHNVKIGERAILTGGFMVAGSTTIGKNFVAGGRSAVSGHLTITDNVTLMTTAMVIQDIKEPGVYGGSSVQPLPAKEFRRNYLSLSKVAEMRKDISRLMKEVFKGS